MDVRWLATVGLLCGCDPLVSIGDDGSPQDASTTEDTGGAGSGDTTSGSDATTDPAGGTAPPGPQTTTTGVFTTGLDSFGTDGVTGTDSYGKTHGTTDGATDGTTDGTTSISGSGVTGTDSHGTATTDTSSGGTSSETGDAESDSESSSGGSTGGDEVDPFVPLDAVDPPGCVSWTQTLPAGGDATKLAVGSDGQIFAAGAFGEEAWVVELDPSGNVLGDVVLDAVPAGAPQAERVIDVGTSDSGRAFVLIERDGFERIASLDVAANTTIWEHTIDDSWLLPTVDHIAMDDMSHLAVSPQGRVMVAGYAHAELDGMQQFFLNSDKFVLFTADEQTGAPIRSDDLGWAYSFEWTMRTPYHELLVSDTRGVFLTLQTHWFTDVTPRVHRHAFGSLADVQQTYAPPTPQAGGGYDWWHSATAVGAGADAPLSVLFFEGSPALNAEMSVQTFVPGPAGSPDTIGASEFDFLPNGTTLLIDGVATLSGDAHFFARTGPTVSLFADGSTARRSYSLPTGATIEAVELKPSGPEALVVLIRTNTHSEIHQVCTLPS